MKQVSMRADRQPSFISVPCHLHHRVYHNPYWLQQRDLSCSCDQASDALAGPTRESEKKKMLALVCTEHHQLTVLLALPEVVVVMAAPKGGLAAVPLELARPTTGAAMANQPCAVRAMCCDLRDVPQAVRVSNIIGVGIGWTGAKSEEVARRQLINLRSDNGPGAADQSADMSDHPTGEGTLAANSSVARKRQTTSSQQTTAITRGVDL